MPNFTKEAVAAKVEEYARRYTTGKDLWTGKCMACGELECDCNTHVEFERLDFIDSKVKAREEEKKDDEVLVAVQSGFKDEGEFEIMDEEFDGPDSF